MARKKKAEAIVPPIDNDTQVDFEIVSFTKLRCPYCGSTEEQRIYGHSPKGYLYVRCGICIRPHADRKAAGKATLSGQPTRYKYRAMGK